MTLGFNFPDQRTESESSRKRERERKTVTKIIERWWRGAEEKERES